MGGHILPCGLCEKQHASRDNLEYHIDLDHAPQNSYRCEICHSRFSSTHGLNYHKDLTNHHLTKDKQLDPLEGLSEENSKPIEQNALILKNETSDISVEEDFFSACLLPSARHECNQGQLDSKEIDDEESDNDKELSNSDSIGADNPAPSPNNDEESECESYLNYFNKVTVDGKTKMKCVFCLRTILSLDACKLHLKKRHNRAQRYAKKNKCEACEHQGRSFKDLRLHTEKAHGVKLAEYIWTCNKCDYTSADQKEFLKHMNDKHSRQEGGSERYNCDLCSRSFSRRPYLEYHVRGVHDNIKDNVCHLCGFSTYMPASLKTHIKTVHDKVKDNDNVKRVHDVASSGVKFQCSHCSFACSQKDYLKIHNNAKHTKVKNYMCELCGYSTYFPGNFKRHKDEVHLGIKNHVCSVCGLAFAQKQQLVFHMKKHRDTPGTAPKRTVRKK
jgi:hypothetical protein